MLLLDIIAVFVLLQGISPLVQEMLGKDPEESFFLVNSLADHQPFASIVLIALGIGLLLGSSRIRRARR